MAVSAVVVDTPRVPGNRRWSFTEVTMDSSYEAEGEKLTPAELGLKRVSKAVCFLLQGSESETVEVGWARYDEEKELIRLFNYKTQKEIAGTKNLEKVKILVYAVGV